MVFGWMLSPPRSSASLFLLFLNTSVSGALDTGFLEGWSQFTVSALLSRYVFKAALVSIETAGGLPVEALVSVDGRAVPGPAGSEPEVRQLQDV